MAGTKRVLIVDDEADSRAYTEAVVSEAGAFVIITASNGEDAIRIARTEVPALVILDMVMPGTNGISVFKRLSEDPKTKAIPVIFLTGISTVTGLPLTVEAIAKSVGAAPRAVLEKPLDPPALHAAITAAIGR
jgi:putative two-component system response regulator